MKIFISSLISGFEAFREAAKEAVLTLHHEPIMAEDFGAQPSSPQVACLQGLRRADLMVLLLGPDYGYPQGTSGISPTHEEYQEARDTKPMLVFVRQGVDREPEQSKFVSEVQAWQTGHFREGFTTPEELKTLIIGAIHEYQLAHAAGPLDLDKLVQTAVQLIPKAASRQSHSGSPMLNVAFAGGPYQRILRPAELEDSSLLKALHQQALFSQLEVFEASKGVQSDIEGAVLVLSQERGASIRLDEQGSLLMQLPLSLSDRERSGFGGMAIIEDAVILKLSAAIAYADWVFERIDPTQRLTQVAIAASITASDYMGWRTQAEDDANPGSGHMRMGSEELPAIYVDRRRAALRYDVKSLAEDLMVPLRRQRKTR